MKHKTKNRLIKRKKGGKTKKMKMKMRRGGGLFSSMTFGIPGVGSVGTCPDKQYYDPKYGWLTQTCTQTPVGPIYKTQYPDAASGAAYGSTTGAAYGAKPWYQIW